MTGRSEQEHFAYLVGCAEGAMLFRKELVTALHILGDRSEECPTRRRGFRCEQCTADEKEVFDHLLRVLGYKSWSLFHEREILRGDAEENTEGQEGA